LACVVVMLVIGFFYAWRLIAGSSELYVLVVSGLVQGRQHIAGAVQWRRVLNRPVVINLRTYKELESLNT